MEEVQAYSQQETENGPSRKAPAEASLLICSGARFITDLQYPKPGSHA